jgi:hypothetical protein
MSPCAARNMIPVSAVENMTFWPELRKASDVAILIDAFSYARRCVSYCVISYCSLLKFFEFETDVSLDFAAHVVVRADLYSFVIKQRVNCDGGSFVVRCICFATELGSGEAISDIW